MQLMKFLFDAILFDLDGTLVDSAPDLAGAVDQMRMNRGFAPYGTESYRAIVGSGARGMLAIGFGITPDHPEFTAMRDEFFDMYEARLTQCSVLFPGVEALLSDFDRAGLPWGIVTNKSGRFSGPLVSGFAELGTAATLISGDTTAHSKPHPAPLIEAARRMAVTSSRCLYVGDDERDIVAGQAGGMGTAVAGWGYLGLGKTPVSQWNADWVFTDPVQLRLFTQKC